MSDTPPDRLAMDPASPFHDQAVLDRWLESLAEPREGA